MAQQLIIKDGLVLAIHDAWQTGLSDKYPGCELIAWEGSEVAPRGEEGPPVPILERALEHPLAPNANQEAIRYWP